MDDLSPQTENYLKVIWSSREWADASVTVGALAARLELAPSSVSEAIRKLADAGLVSHAPYGAIGLTADGNSVAVRIVRKHRLIETFLVDYLGYGWDEIHDEAEILEHAVSDYFIDRLSARLGDPTRDPHGDPIPLPDGTLTDLALVPLDRAELGSTVRIGRVSDSDSGLLRHLEGLGMGLDAVLTVCSRDEDSVTVEHGDTRHALPLGDAASIRVLAAEAAA